MDGIIMAHEILYSMHLSKEKGILLKLNFEKDLILSIEIIFLIHSGQGVFLKKWVLWITKIL
jgi:hypothetical protein